MTYLKQIGLVFVYKKWSTMRCIVLFRLYEKVFLKDRTISGMHVLAGFFSILNNRFLGIRTIYTIHISMVVNVTTLYTCMYQVRLLDEIN